MDRKLTQHKMIIDYLSNHDWITPMQAFSSLGITKLSTRICELERKGYRFKRAWAQSLKGTRYMTYSLIEGDS